MLIIATATAIISIFILGIVVVVYVFFPPKVRHGTLTTIPVSDVPLDNLIEDSGSGGGFAYFNKRTIAFEIKLRDIIGNSRYGEVWHGSWRNDNIAVKIFSSRCCFIWVKSLEICQGLP